MGQEPNPNGYELGIPCPPCMGLKTPKRMLAIVNGVKACPTWVMKPNGFYILEQIFACVWGYDDLEWIITYDANVLMHPFGSSFTIYDQLFRKYFIGSDVAICTNTFSNDLDVLDCDGVVHGYDGSAGVSWGPGI